MSNNVSLKQLNDDLERLEKEAANNITLAGDKEDLERLRIQFLGKKGRLSKILGSMGSFNSSERPIVGQRANVLKNQLQELIADRVRKLKEAVSYTHLTLPTKA